MNEPDEFDRLHRFIRYHLGRFTLGLVRVNTPPQRDGIIDSLTDLLRQQNARLVRVDLTNRHPDNLQQAIQELLPLSTPQQVVWGVVGMEHLIEAPANKSGRPPFATALNAERENLRALIPMPVLLFLTDHAMDRLDLLAPDFFDWYSSVFRFRSPQPQEMPQPTVHEPTPVAPSLLTSENLENRLELLEDRRMELVQQGGVGRARLGQVLQEMGELYARLPQYQDRQSAVSYLKEASEIFHELEQPADEASVLEQLGEVCYWINDYPQAVRRYEAALPIYRQIGARLGEANCIQSLGDVHVMLAEYGLARERYEAALPIYRQIGARLGEANCIKSLGDVHVRLDEYGLARERYEAALPIYRQIGDRLGEANTFTAFGDVDLAEKQFAAARRWYEQSFPIYRDIGDRHWQTYVALQLGKALVGLQEWGQATHTLEAGAALARTIPGQPNLRPIEKLLAEIQTGSHAGS